MSEARCQSQQPLHPPAGQVMKKPVPLKPMITPTTVSGQGPSSGLAKRPTSCQRQSQKAEVRRPPTRQMGPNGWRAPKKEASDAYKWTKATNEVEEYGYGYDDGEDGDDDDDQNEEEEKSKSWKSMMKRKETSIGKEQKWRAEPTKDTSDHRRWPRANKDLSSSEDEDEFDRRSAALSRDKNQIRRKSSVDRRKSTRSSLDNDDSFDHHYKTSRPCLADSGYASSSNSLSPPVELPATPSLENSAPLRSAQILDDELSRRLGEIRLDKDQMKQNADLVNFIQDCVLKHLVKNEYNAKWTKCNQGSYYEKVKIQTPNEYDCMLMCEIRCTKNYYPADVESKAYCTLKLNAIRNGASHYSHRQIQGPKDEDGGIFLSPKKFRNKFEETVRKALENFHQQKTDFTIEFRNHNGRSPAVTIDVRKAVKRARKGEVGDFQFSIDFVPAIRFMEWPKPAENWHLRRLRDVEDRMKKLESPNIYPCAVAKIHPSEYTKTSEDSRLWRISFSAIEKFLMLHADRGLSTLSTPTCRKDVLRLLKLDLVDLKQQRRSARNRTRADGGGDDDDFGFSSFYLKTILLLLTNDREWTTNFVDLSRDDAKWSKDRLRQRYVDALKMVVQSLEMEYIEHYFIEGENLLKLQEMPKGVREHIIDHFQLLCDKYS